MRLLSLGELRGEKFTKQKYGEKITSPKRWDELYVSEQRVMAGASN
jgi:hypothetical protein